MRFGFANLMKKHEICLFLCRFSVQMIIFALSKYPFMKISFNQTIPFNTSLTARKDTLMYYKQLVYALLANIRMVRTRYNPDWTLGYIIEQNQNNFDLSVEGNVFASRIQTLMNLPEDVVLDLSENFTDITVDDSTSTIAILAKFLKVNYKLVSSRRPNKDKLEGDCKTIASLYSGFIDKISSLGFAIDGLDKNTYRGLIKRICNQISNLSKEEMEEFLSLTKRIAAEDNRSLDTYDIKRLKIIKVIRIVMMALRREIEFRQSVLNDVVAVLNPKLVDYTIDNRDYVNDILELHNKELSAILLKKLIVETNPHIEPGRIEEVLSGQYTYEDILSMTQADCLN